MHKVAKVQQAPHLKKGSGINTISKLLHHPYRPSQMISIDHNGCIKTWNIETLTEISSLQMKTPYLTSIIPFQSGFLLGLGNGKLMHLDQEFCCINEYKIHDDCLTDVIELQNSIVTTSFDGRVLFLNKATFKKEKEVEVDNPLHKIVYFNDHLYLAGNPSYKLNIQSFDLEELGSYQNFVIFNNEIFGSSEDSGLTRLKDSDRTFEPCEFVFPIRNTIVMTSGQSVGFLSFEGQNQHMKWIVHKVPNLQQHFSVSAGLQNDQQLIFADQSSKIVKITLAHEFS